MNSYTCNKLKFFLPNVPQRFIRLRSFTSVACKVHVKLSRTLITLHNRKAFGGVEK